MYRIVLILVLMLQIIGASCCFALNNREWDYRSKVHQQEAKEEYEKKLLPESGYMTVQEYEQKSAAKDKAVGNGEYVQKLEDSQMLYVPQPKYVLVRYNHPAGTPELNLHRKLHHDRQEIAPALIAPDLSMMIVPIVSYYARTKSTDCDVYRVPLRQGMPDIEKVLKANIAAKDQTPIFSTDRTLIEYGTFRTITPIDFSPDLRKLLAKEKTGNAEDGIWQTEILVYDFITKQTVRLTEIREAIRHYWRETKDLDIRDFRWDIYPLGFEAENSNRILVAAYAYAGNPTRCLGVWSVDTDGKQSRLVSLSDRDIPVSEIGLKLKEDGVVDPKSIEAEAKLAERYEKQKDKDAKKAEKERKKQLKKEYEANKKEIKKAYSDLKKEDTSKDSKSTKFHRSMPFYKVKGGKPTGADVLPQNQMFN